MTHRLSAVVSVGDSETAVVSVGDSETAVVSVGDSDSVQWCLWVTQRLPWCLWVAVSETQRCGVCGWLCQRLSAVVSVGETCLLSVTDGGWCGTIMMSCGVSRVAVLSRWCRPSGKSLDR